MTPMIYAEDIASRPLYNPDPGIVDVSDLVNMVERKQNRISDLLVGVLKMAIKVGIIKIKQADIFETVFVRGAKPRKLRNHEGHPFLAPDGTAMSIDGVAYGGDARVPAGRHNIDNVNFHPGYLGWLNALLFQVEASPSPDLPASDAPLPDFSASEDDGSALPLGGVAHGGDAGVASGTSNTDNVKSHHSCTRLLNAFFKALADESPDSSPSDDDGSLRRPSNCTQYQIRYTCGHSLNGEFVKCAAHFQSNDKCPEIELEEEKLSEHSCPCC